MYINDHIKINFMLKGGEGDIYIIYIYENIHIWTSSFHRDEIISFQPTTVFGNVRKIVENYHQFIKKQNAVITTRCLPGETRSRGETPPVLCGLVLRLGMYKMRSTHLAFVLSYTNLPSRVGHS